VLILLEFDTSVRTGRIFAQEYFHVQGLPVMDSVAVFADWSRINGSPLLVSQELINVSLGVKQVLSGDRP